MFVTRWYELGAYELAEIHLFENGPAVLSIRIYKVEKYYGSKDKFVYTISNRNHTLVHTHEQKGEPGWDDFKAYAIDDAVKMLKKTVDELTLNFIPPRF